MGCCKGEGVDADSIAMLARRLHNGTMSAPKKVKIIACFSGGHCRWQEENLSNVYSW